MIERRSGRPKGSDEKNDGRKRLISAARDVLREKPTIRFHRSQIAAAAGVTPALMTYYFGEEETLVDGAVKPLVIEYLNRLSNIECSQNGQMQKIRLVISLLLEISRDNGQLVETYINYMKEKRATIDYNFIKEASATLSRIFATANIDLQRSAFLQTAIWGVCKTIAQTNELQAHMKLTPNSPDYLIEVQTELIFELIYPALNYK